MSPKKVPVTARLAVSFDRDQFALFATTYYGTPAPKDQTAAVMFFDAALRGRLTLDELAALTEPAEVVDADAQGHPGPADLASAARGLVERYNAAAGGLQLVLAGDGKAPAGPDASGIDWYWDGERWICRWTFRLEVSSVAGGLSSAEAEARILPRPSASGPHPVLGYLDAWYVVQVSYSGADAFDDGPMAEA